MHSILLTKHSGSIQAFRSRSSGKSTLNVFLATPNKLRLYIFFLAPLHYTIIPHCNLFIDFNSAAMGVKMKWGPALQVFDIILSYPYVVPM